MLRRLGVGIAALLSLCAVEALAHPDVDAGRALYKRGNFKQALVKLKDAERSPSLTEDDLLEVRWLTAACHQAVGQSKLADQQFDALLDLRPLYEPDRLQAPPDLRAAFQQRATAWQARSGIQVGDARPNGAQLEVPVAGPPALASQVALFVRAPGDPAFTPVGATLEGGLARAQPGDATRWQAAERGGGWDIIVEVRNARGIPVARRGDVSTPLRVPVTAAQREAAVNILAPPTPAPAPAPQPAAAPAASAQPSTSAPAEESGSPARLGLLAGGGVLLAGAGVAALVAVVLAAGAVGSWGAFGYAHQQLGSVGGDRLANRAVLENVWRITLVSGATLLPAALLFLVLAAGSGLSGVVALVVRTVM